MPVAQVLNGLRGPWWQNEPMARHTTWRIGGPADLLVIPADRADLALVIANCVHFGVPWTVLGAGSNLLVTDQGIRGVVIRLGEGFMAIGREGPSLIAGAACRLPALARFAAANGLSGLEYAAGIPASLGGAIIMNAGAHGGAIGDCVESVEIVDDQGRLERLTRQDLSFAYRRSGLQGRHCVITEVNLHLIASGSEEMAAKMAQAIERRRATQPLEWPNAGSVFINPPDDFAGRLIEAAGCKGYRIGGAEVSSRHANFIINRGGAKAADVLALIEEIRHRVLASSGVELRTEIQLVGDTGRAM